MKKYIFLLQFLLLSLSVYSQQLEWIPFKWVKDNNVGDKAAMSISVTIDDLPDGFDMQFNLGADEIVFYGNAIEPYLKNNNSLREKLDIATSRFKNIQLHLGQVGFNGRDVFYMKNYADGLASGTIGANFFRDKVLIIDYSNTRLAVSDSLPVEYKNLPCERIELNGNNQAIIPFRIDGKEEWLLFTTSSGSMPLATTRERALAVSDSIVVDSISAQSNEYQLTMIGSKVTKPVEFAGKASKNLTVYYEKNNYFDPFFTENDLVWGMIGNACFWDNVVIIDYKNETFRIK